MRAINQRDISYLEQAIAADVRTVSTDSDTVLKGDTETLGYFKKHLAILRRNDPVNVIATAGLHMDAELPVPCAVLFDGLLKSNVVTFSLNADFHIRRIAFSSQPADLSGTRIMSPPRYPETPVLPQIQA